MKLYHRPPAGRPGRVRWALEEAGLDYELVVLDREATDTDAWAAKQPLNRVPVLEHEDGDTLFESGAMLLHVGDLAGDALTFPPGTRERSLVYQWVLFVSAELEPPMIDVFVNQADDAPLREVTRIVEGRLDGGKHLVGGRFTLADLAVVDALLVGKGFGGLEYSPAVEAYLAEHRQRPARAVADEMLAAQQG